MKQELKDKLDKEVDEFIVLAVRLGLHLLLLIILVVFSAIGDIAITHILGEDDIHIGSITYSTSKLVHIFDSLAIVLFVARGVFMLIGNIPGKEK